MTASKEVKFSIKVGIKVSQVSKSRENQKEIKFCIKVQIRVSKSRANTLNLSIIWTIYFEVSVIISIGWQVEKLSLKILQIM